MHEMFTVDLPSETILALVNTALRARQRGDHAAARVLLRALAARQPSEPRIWLALATVAETREEQRNALEQVIALDPDHPLARRGLAQFQARDTAVLAAPAPALQPVIVEPQPSASDERSFAPAVTFAPTTEEQLLLPEQEIRWPLYALLGAATVIVLLALLFVRPWERLSAIAGGSAAATPLAAVIPAPSLDGTTLPTSVAEQTTAAIAALPTNAPLASQASNTTTTPSSASAQPALAQPSGTASASALPIAAPEATLAPATLVKEGDWHMSLLSAQQALLLDGSIGALQPRGRFVLALITVGNDGANPARIPEGLFTLVDNRGHRYQPQPSASTVYLATYGRGQHGDLGMEDAIPGGGGNVSVPLIFDVPTSVAGLTLRVGSSSQGWSIGGQ